MKTIKGRSNEGGVVDSNTNYKTLAGRPNAMTAHEQVHYNEVNGLKTHSFAAIKSIRGLLKDEISDEQFEEMLKDARR